MSEVRCVQIRYDGGCMSILLPKWLEQATPSSQRKFLKLAAERATDYPENEESVREIVQILGQMVEAAKAKAERKNTEAELDPDSTTAQSEARRANTRLKRLQDIRKDFLKMLEKYNPTRKFD